MAGGLFSAQLGAGTITAGSEPDLAEGFRDNSAVWLEIQVGAETLSPRVRVIASAYAQNASSLQGVVNLDGSGNVGIGTESPAGRLEVKDDRSDSWGPALTVTTNRALPPTNFGGHFSATNSSTDNVALYGSASGGNADVSNNTGGSFEASNAFTIGSSGYAFGVSGKAQGYGSGVTAGVRGHAYGSGTGDVISVLGEAPNGYGTGAKYAGWFKGDVRIDGALKSSTGDNGSYGQLLQSTGTGFLWVDKSTIYDPDAVIGNEVTSAANTTLTRSGSGTDVDPYKLALNLGNVNSWSGGQTFTANTNFPGSGIWNTSGSVGVGTPSPGDKLTVTDGNIRINNTADNKNWVLGYDSTDNYFYIDEYGALRRLYISNGGNVGIGQQAVSYQFQISMDSAAKPSTNTWTIASDKRLKKEISRFSDGLEVIRGINPIKYKYNGLAGLPKDSEGIGVIAQEIKEVAPYTVGTFKAKLDDKAESETELYDFNSHALTFVLINAVKELDAKIGGITELLQKEGGSKTASAPDRSGFVILKQPSDRAVAPAATQTISTVEEIFPVCEPVEFGDLLVTDSNHAGFFCLGRIAADPGVFGVVASSWASYSHDNSEQEPAQAPVATSGVVYCKVDAAYGQIRMNDLLCSSPTPGHAMRAQRPIEPGTVVGKALESLDAGTGTIKVLVMLR